jgi:hypothetical protein
MNTSPEHKLIPFMKYNMGKQQIVNQIEHQQWPEFWPKPNDLLTSMNGLIKTIRVNSKDNLCNAVIQYKNGYGVKIISDRSTSKNISEIMVLKFKSKESSEYDILNNGITGYNLSFYGDKEDILEVCDKIPLW